MKKVARQPSVAKIHPVRVIGSIFRVRRDLTLLIKKHVLPGSGLTLEDADLLLDLYGAAHLGWDDPAADQQGFVLVAALKASLVHSAAALSRRVAALEKQGLLETRKLHELVPEGKVDRRSIALRITGKGVTAIEPVFQRYSDVCKRLLANVPVADQFAVVRTAEELMKMARWGG